MRATIFVFFCLAIVTSQPVSAQSATPPPVAVIVLENHSYGANDVGILGDTKRYIVGNPDAPYINDTLIPQGTLFTNYYATSHPSLPNYLQMVAGATAGCTSDACPKDSVALDNVFHLLGEAGTSFATYAQAMPTDCYLTDAGLYPSDHNPETYLTDLDNAAAHPYGCSSTDQPFPSSWADPLPRFSFIVPDRCHGMEGTAATGPCPHATDALITAGDTWLSQTVPALLGQGAVVIVVFDEATGGDKTHGGGHVFALETGGGVAAGATDGTFYSHNSLL
ncbi:MAG TPA: alkaline phosphatase family protein, partial [Actinomycetota bacterium]|nr:alkaline phosphatase family protein [Actinomycetota bacterium]